MVVTLPLLWRGIDWRLTLPFVLGGLVGIPLGVALLVVAEATTFRFALGLLLIVYCPVMLMMQAGTRVQWGGRWADAASGWIGGVLAGLAGITGPVPTLWTTLRGWDKDTQRGMLQGFNTATHSGTLLAYWLTGRLVPEVWNYAMLIAPAIALPAIGGVLLFRRLSQVAFRRIVLVGLTASGVALLAGSLPKILGG